MLLLLRPELEGFGGLLWPMSFFIHYLDWKFSSVACLYVSLDPRYSTGLLQMRGEAPIDTRQSNASGLGEKITERPTKIWWQLSTGLFSCQWWFINWGRLYVVKVACKGKDSGHGSNKTLVAAPNKKQNSNAKSSKVWVPWNASWNTNLTKLRINLFIVI